MCGMEDVEGIAIFGEERQEWLRKYIEMKNGVPSYATYERVLRMLEPRDVEKFYRSWAKAMHSEEGISQISIDGKTICGAGAEQKVHMVSAWAKEDGLCLGQIKTDEKTNAIMTIPELVKLLDVSDCVRKHGRDGMPEEDCCCHSGKGRGLSSGGKREPAHIE